MRLAREVIPITDRAQWLRLRSRDVTASSAGWLFGAGGSPLRLAALLRRDAKLLDGRMVDAPTVRAGRLLEPAIAAAVAEARPDWRLAKATTYHRLPRYGLGATPDYWLGDDGVVECKSCGVSVFDRWGRQPPPEYLLQVLVQLVCADLERGYVAVMIRKFPELPLHLFEVRRHPEAERRLLHAAAAFHRALAAGRAPPTADGAGLAGLLAPAVVVAPRRVAPRVDISKMAPPW